VDAGCLNLFHHKTDGSAISSNKSDSSHGYIAPVDPIARKNTYYVDNMTIRYQHYGWCYTVPLPA
jgi:hypothetical protein